MADNFERAAGAISAETDGEQAVVAYYKDTYDNMMKCLEGIGLKEVDTVRTSVHARRALFFSRSSAQLLDRICIPRLVVLYYCVFFFVLG